MQKVLDNRNIWLYPCAVGMTFLAAVAVMPVPTPATMHVVTQAAPVTEWGERLKAAPAHPCQPETLLPPPVL